MPQEHYLLALAGLVHDIGKFALRAGIRTPRSVDSHTKGDNKHLHALLTADFVDRFLPKPWRVVVKKAAGNHHHPLSKEDAIVKAADHLSAGERADEVEDDRSVHPMQLLSIFCTVQADNLKCEQEVYWPLRPLEMDTSTPQDWLFPGPSWKKEEAWKAYENLWAEFENQVNLLGQKHSDGEGIDLYIESLLLLLQKYTWCIPSANYKGRPDISLYDHSRVTAALSAILTASNLDKEQLEILSEKPQQNENEIALLVGGDLSGVQDFLYTITSRGAVSALRGRSFYIQLLTEVTAKYVLKALDLPAVNLIYAGGGHFTILARPTDKEKLIDIQRKISEVLLAHHRGDLYLAISAIPLIGTQFRAKPLSQAWQNLGNELSNIKQRRFVELGGDIKQLFAPQGHGGNEDIQCQVCGLEHPQTEIDPRSDETEVRKCPQCFSYEYLGESLRKAEFLILDTVPVKPLPAAGEVSPGDWQTVLNNLGFIISVAESVNEVRSQDKPENAITRSVYAMSKNSGQKIHTFWSANVSAGQRFFVNVTPLMTKDDIRWARGAGLPQIPAEGSIKPFHILEAQSLGIPRLGILRMDIDNLGKIFGGGLGEHASLSRVASLSLAISMFFEGWVEVLAHRNNQETARLYSIYSGGDDLFFVGAWDAVVEIARQVRADLSAFAAGHPGIHASAGICLVGGKYPLSQAAQAAFRAEEGAKHLQWQDSDGSRKQKDAISFLGQSLPWKRFGLQDCSKRGTATVHAFYHLLVEQIERDTSMPLIRRLIDLHNRYQEATKERARKGLDINKSKQPQTIYGPWNWLGYYTLNRLAKERHDESIRQLSEKLKEDGFSSIEWIGLAARWAELRMRQ